MASLASTGNAGVMAAMSGGGQPSASGYRGVTQQPNRRFVVSFSHNKERHTAGCSFATATEAAAALERLRTVVSGRVVPSVAQYHNGIRLHLADNASGYRGVRQSTPIARLQRGFKASYRVLVQVNGAQLHLGYYATAIDAAVAYATFHGR